MIKVIKTFEFLHPIDKQPDGIDCQKVILVFTGKVALHVAGQHPIFAGWYRLERQAGELIVDVMLERVIDMSTQEDVTQTIRDSPEMMAVFDQKIKEHWKSKFFPL